MNLRETRERIGIRPWRLFVFFTGFATALFAVLPLARYSGILDALGLTCDAGEKAVLLEFPQYGGKVVGKDIKGPLGGEVVNFPPLQAPPPGCDLMFANRHASLEQVSAYYEKRLTEHGWKVKRFPVDREGEFEYPHVDGVRDGLRYEVHYWPIGLTSSAPADWSNALDREGTYVYVLVYKLVDAGRLLG
jgi:hypothetical protein